MKRYLQRVFNKYIRPHTPRRIAVYNGVAIRDIRLFDPTDVRQGYEEPLIAAIRNRVTEGDTVVVVGGGRGVSSVAAAHRVGRSGTVTTYEGAKKRYELAAETIELNKADEVTEIHHTVVGSAVQLADDAGDVDTLHPSDLPACDVLVMDCEGTEDEILDSLNDWPETIIVETHGFLDVPEAEIEARLETNGYEVINRGVENDALDVFVLTAVDPQTVESNQ